MNLQPLCDNLVPPPSRQAQECDECDDDETRRRVENRTMIRRIVIMHIVFLHIRTKKNCIVLLNFYITAYFIATYISNFMIRVRNKRVKYGMNGIVVGFTLFNKILVCTQPVDVKYYYAITGNLSIIDCFANLHICAYFLFKLHILYRTL